MRKIIFEGKQQHNLFTGQFRPGGGTLLNTVFFGPFSTFVLISRVLDRFRRYKLQLREFIWCSDIFEILVNTCWPFGQHIGPFRMDKGQNMGKKGEKPVLGVIFFRYSRSQRVLDRFRRYKLQLKEFIWCSDIFEILVNTCWPVGHHIGPFRMGKGQIISAHWEYSRTNFAIHILN